MSSKNAVSLLVMVLGLAMFGTSHAAPFSASAYVCGGGVAEKDLVALKKGQVFDLTDVTIANSNASGRLVAVTQGAWPPKGAAPAQLTVQVEPGSTFKQQFKTPISYASGGAVRIATVCPPQNLAIYVTVSGDLH
jgi:hypothetical protein